MATASDDGTVHVFHAKVFSDLLQNPLIVPVKILRGHEVVGNFGVLDCQFHPSQPWIFTAGADRTIRCWQNLP
jgi:ribosome biogenesis protein ERB1